MTDRIRANLARDHHDRGWRALLLPKPFDLVTSLLYLCTLGFFLYNMLSGATLDLQSLIQVSAATFATLGLLLMDRIEYRMYADTPTAWPAILLFGARIILIELFAQIDNFNYSPFLYLVIPFYASLYFGIRVGYWVAALVWTFYLGKLYLYQADWYDDQIIVREFFIFSLGLVFAMTTANVMARERASRARAEQLLAELERSHNQLRAYATQVEELAAIEERNRLARDIHDSLGHYLTVINVQLEKALAFRREKPDEADQAVSDAKQLAGEALRDVRRSVGALRAGPQDQPFVFRQAMEELVEHVRNGLPQIELCIRGDEKGFSNRVLMSLYRAAQEGLTNIQKHARATSVTLTIDFETGNARLSLIDDGQGFLPNGAGQLSSEEERGYGLQGIRERLELVGGQLHISSKPGNGTSLLVVIQGDGTILPVSQAQGIKSELPTLDFSSGKKNER